MRKLFSIIAIAAVAATAGWNFSQSQKEVELSDLALANVEALARYEGQGDACTEFTTMTCTSVVTDNWGNTSVHTYYNMFASDAC